MARYLGIAQVWHKMRVPSVMKTEISFMYATQTAPGDALVSFRNVRKSYDGETPVLRQLDLDIAKGEFLTLLGPSGSGKTTALMLLAGFEPVTHGDIYLAGQNINRLPPHKRGIGMVFQNYALFPHMTVAENLAFPLQLRKMARADIADKVARALALVELPDAGSRRPRQLSGGQQQRVAVARALVFEPELVLMDEPLAALDRQLREQLQYELKHLHENLGVTVLYVTHDQSEALVLSDRIAVLNDGIIQQLSTPQQLYECPDNSFVARFIGENNKLSGTVASLAGGSCSVVLDDGTEVRADAVNVSAVGERTTISLRPERVALDPDQKLDNSVRGEIREIIYHGDHLRIVATVCGNPDFIAKVRNHGQHRPLAPGQSVAIGWAAADCKALDAVKPAAGPAAATSTLPR